MASKLKSPSNEGITSSRLLRADEVQKLTNVGKTKRAALIAAGFFPAPIRILNEFALPGRTRYWLHSDIETWIKAQAERCRADMQKAIKADPLHSWMDVALQAKGVSHA